jgi:hypothetical protein
MTQGSFASTKFSLWDQERRLKLTDSSYDTRFLSRRPSRDRLNPLSEDQLSFLVADPNMIQGLSRALLGSVRYLA